MGNEKVTKMDPLSATVEKVKSFAKSTQSLIFTVLLRRPDNFSSRNPIEILKRLQREAFSDLMKLRDRQEKVEKLLTFYGKSEAKSNTHLRGEVDLVGAVLLMSDVDEEHCQAIDRAGIRTGLDSRFLFETSVRGKDGLSVEFTTNRKGREMGGTDDVLRSSLSLAKVVYKANACYWLSGIAIPVGAQSRDCDVTTNYSQQGKGLTDMPYFGPPLLHKNIGSALGITVRKWNIVASLAHSVSGMGMLPGFDGIGHCLNTFGQVVCQLPRQTKLSFTGLHRAPKLAGHCIRLGALAVPIGFLVPEVAPDIGVEGSGLPLRTKGREFDSTGAVALKIESDLDEYTRLGGWIEMKRSNPRHMQWAVSMADISEDELGWGLSLGGIIEDPKSWDQFQVESYVTFNLGKKFSLKPGVAYIIDGNSRTLAFMLRSNWSL